MKLKYVIVLLFFMFATIVCSRVKESSFNQTKIKISYWGSVEEIKAMKKIVQKIEQTYPKIKIILEHVSVGNDPSKYTQKILTEAAAGTAPDIAFNEVNLFVDFYSKGIFVDLTPYIENDNEFSIKDYFPKLIERFTVNNKIYILPRDVAPFAVVYYNKDLFNNEGIKYPTDNWNMNDLLRIAKKLTKHDKSGKILQYGFYTWAWFNFIYSFGGKVVDNVSHPTKCLLNSSQSVMGLQFYLDLMYKYKVMPTPSALASGYQGLFKTGKLAMYCAGIWETPQLRKGLNFDWDVVMFPKGPKGIRGFSSGGSGYGITRWCKNKEVAWKILKMLASPDAMKDLAKIGLAQPASRSLAESDVWAKSSEKPANKKMLNKAVNYIIFDPFTPKWSFIQKNIISIELDPVFTGKKPLRPALNKVTKEINDIL